MKELLFVICIALYLPFYSQNKSIIKNGEQLRLFSEFYNLLDENYLDTLVHDKLMNLILKQTASTLDPYTRYFTKQETVARNKSWSGISYAGIGASVNYINDEVIVEYCKKGYGADSVGLMIGDVIISINDSLVTELNLLNTVKLLKGPNGSTLKIKVKRGEDVKSFTLIRKNIITPSIGYANLVTNEIAIIKINQFLRGSGAKFKTLISDLSKRGAKGFIIDLRGNRGGIVKECISMLSVFLPKNTLICELKSKDLKSNYKEFTKQNPLNTKIPIVILIDENTMSSSEIFAGAMQDLDRSVLIGEGTFGKGLVQGTRVLSDQSTLYVTAARYHLPSGRCIHKNLNHKSFVSPSINETKNNFLTSNGRVVKANNGISPEIILQSQVLKSEIINSISISRLDFNFAVSLFRSLDFRPNENVISYKKEYLSFLLDNIDIIHLKSEQDWKKITRELMLSKTIFNRSDKDFAKRKKKLISLSIDELYNELKELIILHSEHLEGLYNANLKTDDCVQKAIELLSDHSKYKKLINF